MSLTRSLALLAVLGTLTLSACGDDDDGGSAGDTSSESSNETTSDATDDEGSDEPSGPLDICSKLTADEVSETLAATVTAEDIPGGGCNFSQENPRAASTAINEVTVGDFAGGFEGVRTGVTSVIEGEVETLDGVGDDAFVVVGPTPGGTAAAGAGAVLLGETVVQITVLQGVDLSDEEVRELTTGMLSLVASKA